MTGRVSFPPAAVVPRPTTYPELPTPLLTRLDRPLNVSHVPLMSVWVWLVKSPAWRLPMDLAFAVKGASSMDSRVIGGV